MLPRFCFQESAAGFRIASVAKHERKGQPTFLNQGNPFAINCVEFCLVLYIISMGLQQQWKSPKPSLQFQAACEESKASCSVRIAFERLWRVGYGNALAKRPRITAHVPSATMATRVQLVDMIRSSWWHASVSRQQLFSSHGNTIINPWLGSIPVFVFVGSLSSWPGFQLQSKSCIHPPFVHPLKLWSPLVLAFRKRSRLCGTQGPKDANGHQQMQVTQTTAVGQQGPGYCKISDIDILQERTENTSKKCGSDHTVLNRSGGHPRVKHGCGPSLVCCNHSC